MRLWLAIRAFFAALTSADAARRVEQALAAAIAGGEAAAEPAAGEPPERAKPAAPQRRPARSDAVALLAALQREARFVDLVQESLDDYSDDQVGAASRDVLRDCRKVLDRIFALEAVAGGPEGQEIAIPADFDPGRYRLSGNVTGEAPRCGHLRHHGWRVSRCELPEWSGSEEAARIVSPAEIELS